MLVIWFVFRVIMTNAKKQADMRRKAEREEQAGDYVPKPVEPARPRGLGGWAEMLGKLTDGEETVFTKPAAPQTPWRNEAAFPPALPTPAPVTAPAVRKDVYVPLEGADERQEYVPAKPTREALDPDVLSVRFDAPALVKGVIFAEVLTRPVQRRRPGMRSMR